MYEKILAPNLAKQKTVAFRTGIALGINIFLQYFTQAAFFYVGAEIVSYYEGEVTPANVMSSIMLVMMGAMLAAGSAS